MTLCPWEPVKTRMAGWTIDALATQIGVDRRTVHRWAKDGVPPNKMDLIATRLDCRPSDIWPDTGPAHSPPDSDEDEPEPGPAATSLGDHRDRRLEALLGRHEAAAELAWVDVDTIDWPTTEARQVRSEPAALETIESYRDSLDGGAVFPAGLAVAGNGGLVILAGVHRGRAYELAGRVTMPVYLLDSAVAEGTQYLIAVEDNTTHGVRFSQAELIEHAFRMIDELGLSRKEAARRVGLSQGMVERAAAVRSSGATLASMGHATQWGRLSPSGQWRLAMSSRGNTEVLVEAVLTAAAVNLNTTQAYDLATRISAAMRTGDTGAALLVIEDYEMANRPDSKAASRWHKTSNGGASFSGSPVVRIRAHCRALAEFDPDDVIDSCMPADAWITAELLKRAVLQLARIGARLDAVAVDESARQARPS